MAARTWVVVTLLATVALAGCTNPSDDPAPADPAPAQPADPAPAPSAQPGAPSGGSAPAPRPQDWEFTDGGSIQGPFQDSWEIDLASPTYKAVQILFTLDGLEPGTPPTAHVNLALLDPQGATLRSATLGLGGSGNVADWTFAPGELAAAGAYRLVATPGQAAPLPSAGLASYGVHMAIDY